jgi:hypothetical protein
MKHLLVPSAADSADHMLAMLCGHLLVEADM